MNENQEIENEARKNLLEELKSKGIRDERILSAIGKIPRHCFIDKKFLKFSYLDQPLPIGEGQTISQPYTVAFQTLLLNPEKNDRILEVGTGSGYQTAVLTELNVEVYTIERQYKLYLKARNTLHELGYHPHFFFGDGYNGLPEYAPFDKILITAGTEHVPEKLLQQLTIGGRMVTPVGSRQRQEMTLIERTGEYEYKTSKHGYFIFVPMQKGVEE